MNKKLVVITSIIILFFVGILAYSKAYKVKNNIIEIIESALLIIPDTEKIDIA